MASLRDDPPISTGTRARTAYYRSVRKSLNEKAEHYGTATQLGEIAAPAPTDGDATSRGHGNWTVGQRILDGEWVTDFGRLSLAGGAVLGPEVGWLYEVREEQGGCVD